MPTWGIIAICCGVFLALVAVQKLMKSKHPVRNAFLCLLIGPLCMLCVNLTSVFTGVVIPVSPLSVSASAVLGIPGVTSMLLLQMFI